MTLIVGILCEDGVALATDRQGTNNTLIPLAKQPVVAQATIVGVTKVVSLGTSGLLASAGNPAIGDEYEFALKKHHPGFPGRRTDVAIDKMKGDIRGVIDPHLKTAAIAAPLLGSQAYGEATIECLLIGHFNDGPKLLQIQREGTFDIAKPENPIRTIGSGQLHAEPFLYFLKKTFWPERLPTVQEGILAACWTIEHAIEVGAPMVGLGCNAYSLSKESGKYKISQVSPEHMQGHRDFIAAARQQLRELANLRQTTPAEGLQVPTMKEGQ